MNVKWYIGALIAIISYFVVEQQSVDVPNQEVLLTFIQGENTSSKDLAIETVKAQLLSLGARNVTISSLDNGSLKVSYYSHLAIQNVKEQLFKDLDDSTGVATALYHVGDEPVKENIRDYQIDVYEIQENVVSGFDNEGKCYFELKQDYNRGSQVLGFVSPVVTIDSRNQLTAIAVKVRGDVLFAFNDSTYKIPEVRAGPIS
ncbi:hypothetical protein LY01_02407 [Nonlabens xylanidelens]|uniref:Uncharacterized protein n=1 Tax=Nonlabens xylanidelens TaxID=191564 RepID=A0A2S6IHD7_9FLAO|nr:hypothetical protein [Nonlabens xylanidelens]PPK93624.1 hypothetical protein LY01_02407 [Nonlabens xylanidelens]PQJ17792.1 hypothetical protein BST94_12230 [Nonlabens xylanidelens]